MNLLPALGHTVAGCAPDSCNSKVNMPYSTACGSLFAYACEDAGPLAQYNRHKPCEGTQSAKKQKCGTHRPLRPSGLLVLSNQHTSRHALLASADLDF